MWPGNFKRNLEKEKKPGHGKKMKKVKKAACGGEFGFVLCCFWIVAVFDVMFCLVLFYVVFCCLLSFVVELCGLFFFGWFPSNRNMFVWFVFCVQLLQVGRMVISVCGGGGVFVDFFFSVYCIIFFRWFVIWCHFELFEVDDLHQAIVCCLGSVVKQTGKEGHLCQRNPED